MEWIKKSAKILLSVIGFFTALISAIGLFRNNTSLLVVLASSAILLGVLVFCLYILFARTASAGTMGLKDRRFRKKWQRILAWIGTGLVPAVFLAFGLLSGVRGYVVQAVAGTHTPTASPTPTFTSTATPTATATGTPTLTPSATSTASTTATSTWTPTPSATGTPAPTRAATPYLANGFCGQASEPCIYQLNVNAGESWEVVAANTAFQDQCKWPVIASLNRDVNGRYRQTGSLVKAGIFVPAPSIGYVPMIVNSLGQRSYLAECEDQGRVRLPCRTEIQLGDNVAPDIYAPLAIRFYGEVEENGVALDAWISGANLADGCTHQPLRLLPGVTIVIPALPPSNYP